MIMSAQNQMIDIIFDQKKKLDHGIDVSGAVFYCIILYCIEVLFWKQGRNESNLLSSRLISRAPQENHNNASRKRAKTRNLGDF
jgi:hypothetical protein